MPNIPNLAKATLLMLVPLTTYAADCEVTTFEELAANSPYGVTLSHAELIDEPGDYCQVEGLIANAEDGQSQIKFRVNLPDESA